jgi:hypothetical protein
MKRKRCNYFVLCYSVFSFLKSLFFENDVKHSWLHTTLNMDGKSEIISIYISRFAPKEILQYLFTDNPHHLHNHGSNFTDTQEESKSVAV